MTTSKKIGFIHTSPAAIGPLMQFYSEAAPELEITNLLDDGLLRLLAAKNFQAAETRLSEMIRTAREVYGAELAMITCSSVSKEMSERLGKDFAFPVLKIDYPMARLAVRTGKRIGVAATFPPTLEPTGRLLKEAAIEAGTSIEIIQEVAPEAYKALLANDTERHDELLLAVIDELERRDVSAIVLAQVSMARILPRVDGRTKVPVLSSLHTSLNAIRDALN
ncbi:MAG TPA: aspartate/glutamate racemase family protein [Pyrinomonadaceae bacterium]|jgi:Asp/Glu/hydantoin racemase